MPREFARRAPDDNLTAGIILCVQNDASVVRQRVLHGNEKRFAGKYRFVLPSEEVSRAEPEQERRLPDRYLDTSVLHLSVAT